MTGVEFTLLLIAVLMAALGPILLKFILSELLLKELARTAPVVKLVDNTIAKVEQRYESPAFEKLQDAYTAEIHETLGRMNKLQECAELTGSSEHNKAKKTREARWKCPYCNRSVKFDSHECPGCGAPKD